MALARRLPGFMVLPALLVGCATTPPTDATLLTIDQTRLPPADISLTTPGLEPCTDNPDRTVRLNSEQPVIVLVHGCFGSAGRFRSLAQVYAFQGQQAICFTYDDRDSLIESSKQLRASLNALSQHMRNTQMTVVGHSQGGLIARRALISDGVKPIETADPNLRLATVSAPFSGIASAQHCGSERARKWSLGIVSLICRMVTGSKWRDITYSSDFIRRPGQLAGQVEQHLNIVTDERDSCRKYNSNGKCADDDFVFSLKEQRQAAVESDRNVNLVEVKAGHAEIVGDDRVVPVKLIDVLQQNGFMNRTLATERAAFERLLATLYLSRDNPSAEDRHR